MALVSGGVESLIVVERCLRQSRRVVPLYVRCGLRWEAAEQLWLRRWLQRLHHPRLMPLHTVDLPVQALYQTHWSLTGRGVPSMTSADAAVYLPGRNVLLVGAAAVYAARRGLSTIALGVLAGNPFSDASPTFFQQFARCLRAALAAPIRILTPLRHLTKAQAIAAHPKLPFQLTWSCLHPQGRRHCGRCNKCAERQRAFRAAHLLDSTSYAS